MLLLLIEGSLDLKYEGKRRVKKKRGHMAVILQVVSPPCRGSVVPMKVICGSHEGHLHNTAAVVPSYPTDKANNCPFFFNSLPLLVELAKLRLRRKPGYCQE